MKKIIPLAMLLAFCRPAKAEWDNAAKGSAEHLFQSARNITRGFHRIVEAIHTDPSQSALTRSFVRNAIRARIRIVRGYIYLMDGDGGSQGVDVSPLTDVTGEDASFEALTRDQVLIRAFAALDEAQPYLDAALSDMQALDAAVGTNDTSLNLAFIDQAISEYNAFDRSLDYTEPRLQANIDFALAVGGANWPVREKSAEAGPHGNYRRFLRDIARTENRAYAAMEHFTRAQELGGPDFFFDNNCYDYHFITSPRLSTMAAFTAGIETGEFNREQEAIDTMLASGTTNRGREFFQLARQQMYGVNAVSRETNALGIASPAGIPAWWMQLGLRMTRNLQPDPTVTVSANVLDEVLKGVEDWMKAWMWLDNAVFTSLEFRYFTNVGPPGSICKTCDPDTTMDQDGVCVGTADCLECPAFEAQWALGATPAEAIAQCVEVP